MTLSEQDYWTEKAKTIRRTQLETVRAAATTWSTLFGAVLGIFSTAAFAGGLPSLDKLSDTYQGPVKVATIVAVALTLAATILAGLASGATAKKTSDQAWDTTQANAKSAAERAFGKLKVAKFCGAAAAALVVVGSIAIFLEGEDSAPAKAPFVIAVVDGTAHCGRLTGSSDSLKVGDAALEGVDSLTVVGACP